MSGVNLAGLYGAHLGQHKVAYLDLTGERTAFQRAAAQPSVVTYDQFDRRCAQVAGGLVGLGLGFGDRVVILSDNSVDCAALYLGICRIGAVTVPLNTKLAAEGLRYILQDAGVKVVFTDVGQAGKVAAAPTSSGSKVVLIGGPVWEEFEHCLPAGMELVNPGHVAMQIYTSGSTGRPSGH